MRLLVNHKVNPCNDKLKLAAIDKPAIGGASCRYEISGFNSSGNPSEDAVPTERPIDKVTIFFQNGPITEKGINGITNEALLAILEDRLAGFQNGPYKCDENASALGCIRAAQTVLKSRTQAREARGVEGTHAI